MRSSAPAGIGWFGRSLTAACLALSLVAPQRVATAAEGPRGLEYSCRLVATELGREITLTFRLRTNSAGDAWRVRLFHDDELIFSKLRITNADGNLKVVRVEPNLAGTDTFEGRARHLGTGAVCKVESRI
jgi:hypothetical protein